MDHNFEKYVKPNMVALTDKYEIKILICYFLKQLDKPITKTQLTEIATGDGIINYFLFTEAFDELLDNKLLYISNIDGKELVELSQIAGDTAEEFKTIVPKSFRDKIVSAGLQFFARLKAKNISVDIEEKEKGASVRFSCRDSGAELMDLSLYAPDITQAEYIKEKILADPSDFYSKIVDFVIDNK